MRDARSVVIADLPPVITPANLGSVAAGTLFTRTGHFTDASGAEDSWTATVQYDAGPVLPLPLNPDHSFTLQHVFLQNSPHAAKVTVTDRFGQSDTETFAMEVTNVAPTVQAGSDVAIRPNTTFQRQVDLTDPGADTWTAQVSFGDGSVPVTVSNLTDRNFALSHLYQQTGRFPVTVTVSDSDGASGSDAFFVDVMSQPPLEVMAFQPVASGFQIEFNRPPVSTALNLFETETAGLGPSDMTVVGAISGPVQGSLILAADGHSMTFVRTGGPLAPDTYTVTLRSAANGLRDDAGWMLDGDGNGVMGDDFVTSFTVGASPRVLSVPEFARGPGQAINLPAVDLAAGIPIQLTGGTDVNAVSFDLRFDPALLSVNGVTKDAAAMLSSAHLTADLSQAAAGLIHVDLTGLAGLSATPLTLLHLQASVPANASYGAKHLLDIQKVALNDGALAGSDDDGMHLVAYLGDTDGQPRYSAADALRVQRVVVRLDGGFSPYPLIDPLIVGDVNGNGRLDAGDALLIQRKVVRLPVPELPDLPSPLPAIPSIARSASLDMTRISPTADESGSPTEIDLRTIDIATPAGQESKQAGLDAGRVVLKPAVQPKGDASDSGVLTKAASIANSARPPISVMPPYAPVFEQQHAADAEPSSKATAPAPVIDWTGPASAVGGFPTIGTVENAAWKSEFVNNLGLSEEEINPNTTMRLKLPVAIKVRPVMASQCDLPYLSRLA